MIKYVYFGGASLNDVVMKNQEGYVRQVTQVLAITFTIDCRIHYWKAWTSWVTNTLNANMAQQEIDTKYYAHIHDRYQAWPYNWGWKKLYRTSMVIKNSILIARIAWGHCNSLDENEKMVPHVLLKYIVEYTAQSF